MIFNNYYIIILLILNASFASEIYTFSINNTSKPIINKNHYIYQDANSHIIVDSILIDIFEWKVANYDRNYIIIHYISQSMLFLSPIIIIQIFS